LKIINKTIPYPILFTFIYKDNFAYGILFKDEMKQSYYFSEWDENIEFDFNALTLEKVYQNIIKKFVKDIDTDNTKFDEVIIKDQTIKSLEQDIQKLQGKIRRETQFNKKVELNKLLHIKQQELKELK
jgi:hypothetical protein